jgi:hypothetical protein
MALVAAAGQAACGGGHSGASEEPRLAELWPGLVAESDVPARCLVARVPFRLEDGAELYVEPEELLRLGNDLLVVGTPTYVWPADPGGQGDTPLADAHVAARFDLDGRTRLIEKPIPGTIGRVRAVALGDERWGLLFDEVHPDSLPSKHHLLALWYAEHDGARWTSLERVPAPEEGVLDLWADSELVRSAEGLMWVVALRLASGGSQLLHYERVGGRWRHEVISDEWAELVTLAGDPVGGTAWLAHFSTDPDFSEWRQSLRLHRRVGGTWELVDRIAEVPPGVKVRDPRVIARAGGPSISWWLLGGPDREAHAHVGWEAGGRGVSLRLDPSAVQVVPVDDIGASPSWVEGHLDAAGQLSELRLVRVAASGAARTVEVVASSPNPFPSFFAAISVANEVVVVGPEPGAIRGRPTVRSLILRLSTTCT